jgi:hypothetical protein
MREDLTEAAETSKTSASAEELKAEGDINCRIYINNIVGYIMHV